MITALILVYFIIAISIYLKIIYIQYTNPQYAIGTNSWKLDFYFGMAVALLWLPLFSYVALRSKL